MAEGAYSAGTIFLQVVPSYKGLQESIRKKVGDIDRDLDKNMTADAEKTGKKVGKVLGEGVSDGVKKELDKTDAYTKQFARRVNRALSEIGDSADLSNVRRKLESLKDIEIDVDLNAAQAEAELASLAAEAKAVGALSPDIRVQTNAKAAAAGLLAVAAAARTANNAGGGGRGIRGFFHGMDGDSQSAANSFRAFNAVVLAATSLGAGLIPILGAMAGGLAAIGTAGSGAAGGLGVMILGFSGIGDAVSELGTAADEVDETAKKVRDAGEAARNALEAVRDAERGLARARQDAAEANEDAARTTSRAVRDAAEANRDAAQRVREAQRDAAEANRDAARQIIDAQRSAAEANEDAARRVRDAQQAAADAVEDALERQADAERRYASAQRDAASAQRALTEARREARQELEDIQDQQRQNALDERQAVIDLFNAHVEAQATLQDPGATNLEKEQASINLEQAKLRLEEIREEEKSLARERKAGVNGTDTVRNAQDALTQALESQRDAQEALGEATQAVDEARRDGAEAVTEALQEQRQTAVSGARAIAEAQRNAAQVARESAQAISEAQRTAAETARDGAESIADAERAQARTRQDGIESVNDAQRTLTRAQRDYRRALRDTREVGVEAMDDVRTAMSKLSPAGRRFARFLHSLRDDFYRVRAAAQEGMLPGVQSAMQMVISKYGPAFTRYVRRMARTVGGLFEHLGRRLTKDGGPFQSFFQMLDRTGPRLLRQFGRGLIIWGEIFASIFTTMEPYAMKLSRALLRMSRVALRFVESPRGKNWIRDFMDYAVEAAPKVLAFFSALWGAFVNLSRALAPIGEAILGIVTLFLEWIANMDPTQLRILVVSVLALVAAFQAAFGIMSLVAAASAPFAGTIALIILGIVALGIAFYAAWQRSETFQKVMKRVFKVVGAVAKWLFDKVLKPAWAYTKWAWKTLMQAIAWWWKNVSEPVFKAIGRVATWLWKNVLKPVWGAIKTAWRALVASMKWVWNNILHPVFKAIWEVVKFLWKYVLKPIFLLISAQFRLLAFAIGYAWRNIWKPIWDLIVAAARWLWRNVLKPIFDAIKAGFRAVGDGIKWVWENIIKPAWDLLKQGIRNVRDVFKDVIGGIKRWWDKLKNIAKGPVRFVVDTVINKGLIGGFNKLAEWLNFEKLKEVKLPKGFKDGGIPSARDTSVFPGYSPGRDIGFIGISGGEGILRPEATRAVGGGTIEAMNAAARNGGTAAVERLLGGMRFMGGFARGGLVDRLDKRNPKKRVWPTTGHITSTYANHDGVDINARGDDRGNPVWSAADGVVRYVGSGHGYGAPAVFIDHNGVSFVYGHLSGARVKAGQPVRAGQQIGRVGNTGNSTGPHLHFGIPGGTYQQAMNFLSGASIKMGQYSDWTSDAGNALSGVAGWVRGAIGNLAGWFGDRINGGLDKMVEKFGGPSPMLDSVAAFPKKAVNGIVDWISGNMPSGVGESLGTLPGGAAGSFGPGAQGIWKSLMSTGFYSKKQAAGVMGNMMIESGLNPYIAQGGARDTSPAGNSGGWGLVQWTPGTKIKPYLDRIGGYGAPEQITALTQQLRGIGSLSEVGAGQKLRSTNSVDGAAWAFGKYYERPKSLSSTIDERRRYAQAFYERFAGRPNLYDDGGFIPPGLSTVLNLTGDKEKTAVLTDEQWAAMQRVGDGGGGGFTYAPTFQGSDLTAADVADDLMHAYRRMRLGGVYTGARD